MTDYAERLGREHTHLREHVEQIRLAAREIPALSPEERAVVLERILDFLEGTLTPHAREEERSVYPVVARSLGSPLATATMARDHEAIRKWTAALEVAHPEDTAHLQEVLYGLYALISVHLWKEDVEYLPVLEQEAPVLIHEP